MCFSLKISASASRWELKFCTHICLNHSLITSFTWPEYILKAGLLPQKGFCQYLSQFNWNSVFIKHNHSSWTMPLWHAWIWSYFFFDSRLGGLFLIIVHLTSSGVPQRVNFKGVDIPSIWPRWGRLRTLFTPVTLEL